MHEGNWGLLVCSARRSKDWREASWWPTELMSCSSSLPTAPSWQPASSLQGSREAGAGICSLGMVFEGPLPKSSQKTPSSLSSLLRHLEKEAERPSMLLDSAHKAKNYPSHHEGETFLWQSSSRLCWYCNTAHSPALKGEKRSWDNEQSQLSSWESREDKTL